MGQRTNEIVDPECQPRPVELRLQAGSDGRFPRAGTAVEDDDLDAHPGDSRRLPFRLREVAP